MENLKKEILQCNALVNGKKKTIELFLQLSWSSYSIVCKMPCNIHNTNFYGKSRPLPDCKHSNKYLLITVTKRVICIFPMHATCTMSRQDEKHLNAV